VSVQFVIQLDGSVADAKEDDGHEAKELGLLPPSRSPLLLDAAVVSCIVHEFAKLTFPKPDGEKVTVVYPIIFAPGD